MIYEFRTVFLYLLHVLAISTRYRWLDHQIKKAAMSGSVRYSGGKWSLKHPIRVELTKSIEAG